jgi:hypothetical protein
MDEPVNAVAEVLSIFVLNWFRRDDDNTTLSQHAPKLRSSDKVRPGHRDLDDAGLSLKIKSGGCTLITVRGAGFLFSAH